MTSKLIRTALVAAGLLAGWDDGEAASLKIKPLPFKAPPLLIYNWSGLYLGFNGGAIWGRSSWDAPVPFGINMSDGLAGFTFGYNFQSGSVVWGFEGDIDWVNVGGSTPCAASTCGFSNRWLDTVRVRVGQSFDRFLPYVTGGIASGGLHASFDNIGTTSATRVGWTAGAGIEMSLGSRWSGKLEYLYVDLGSFFCTVCAPNVAQNVSFTANVVRAGLNYKFNLGGAPIIPNL